MPSGVGPVSLGTAPWRATLKTIKVGCSRGKNQSKMERTEANCGPFGAKNTHQVEVCRCEPEMQVSNKMQGFPDSQENPVVISVRKFPLFCKGLGVGPSQMRGMYLAFFGPVLVLLGLVWTQMGRMTKH